MCTDLRAISILHSMLQNKRKWMLVAQTPDTMEDVGEKAKSIAEKRLCELSTFKLWWRYCTWR